MLSIATYQQAFVVGEAERSDTCPGIRFADETAGTGIPDAHHAVETAGSSEETVGTPGGVLDFGLVASEQERVRRALQIPETRRTIDASADEPALVRAELHVADRADVTAELGNLLSGVDLPDRRRAIRTRASGQPAGRAEHEVSAGWWKFHEGAQCALRDGVVHTPSFRWCP
jgi:hypothetical protein